MSDKRKTAPVTRLTLWIRPSTRMIRAACRKAKRAVCIDCLGKLGAPYPYYPDVYMCRACQDRHSPGELMARIREVREAMRGKRKGTGR